MKYLPLLLLLVGCVTHPKKREPQLIEEIPMGETWVDDMIEEGIKIGPIDYMSHYTTVEIDVSFFTHRRYMVYINIIRS